MTVPEPAVDPLAVADDAAIDPRPREELVPEVMELRDCSYDDAERYVLDRGRAQVERELEARWTA